MGKHFSIKTLTVFFFVLLLSIPSAMNAQSRLERKQALLTSLKEGTLVVRLRSHQKKLARLEELMNQENISPKAKERYINIKEQTIFNRDKFNQDFANTMLSDYTFSKVLVMYDYDYEKLKKNELDGIFLDKNLKPLDNTPSITGDVFYFGEGQTMTSGNSLEGILLLDANNEQVPDWLPNFYKAKNSWKTIKGAVSKNNYLYRPARKILEKFQPKLLRLWESLGAVNQ